MQLVRKRSSPISGPDENAATAGIARDDAELVAEAKRDPNAFDAL